MRRGVRKVLDDIVAREVALAVLNVAQSDRSNCLDIILNEIDIAMSQGHDVDHLRHVHGAIAARGDK